MAMAPLLTMPHCQHQGLRKIGLLESVPMRVLRMMAVAVVVALRLVSAVMPRVLRTVAALLLHAQRALQTMAAALSPSMLGGLTI